MIGVPLKPGCVVPSMTTGSVMVGRAEVGLMVFTPLPMPKAIVSSPGVMFALRMAWRSDPRPESLVLVTVNVARSDLASSSSRHQDRGTRPSGRPFPSRLAKVQGPPEGGQS